MSELDVVVVLEKIQNQKAKKKKKNAERFSRLKHCLREWSVKQVDRFFNA